MEETQQLKKKVDLLRDLGEDWRKNMTIMNYAARGDRAMLESIKRLSKKSNQGNLVKIALALIAFPLPIVIDDVLGWSLLAAGLIQRKIKNSALYLEDFNKIYPGIVEELQKIREEMV